MKTFLDEARTGRFKNAAQFHDQSPIFGLPFVFHSSISARRRTFEYRISKISVKVETRDHGPKNIAKKHNTSISASGSSSSGRGGIWTCCSFALLHVAFAGESAVLGEPGACKLFFCGSPSRFGCDAVAFLRENPSKKHSSSSSLLPCFACSVAWFLLQSLAARLFTFVQYAERLHIYPSFLSPPREHSRSELDPTSRDHRKPLRSSHRPLHCCMLRCLLLPRHREEARRKTSARKRWGSSPSSSSCVGDDGGRGVAGDPGVCEGLRLESWDLCGVQPILAC